VLAVIGAAFAVFQVYGYVAWALDGGGAQFEVDQTVPADGRLGVRLGQTLMPAVMVAWLAYVGTGVVRLRALTWPALVTAAWALTYWQESLANVTGARFAYNSAFVDRGDWTFFLPVLPVPGPGLPQPLGMEPFVFLGLFPALSFLSLALIRGFRKITKDLPVWVPILAAYVVILTLELLIEFRSISQGVHAYPEVFGAMSIRDGQPDQFPLYENWLLGLMWFLPGLAVFLLRDRAAVPPATPPRWRPGGLGTVLTVLAAAGALNVAFLIYNLIAFVWLPGDTVAPMPAWLQP
jgi:hypothetical protein